MSKGSAPRPFEVGHDVFTANWEAIFGKQGNLAQQVFEDQVRPIQKEIDEKMIGMEQKNE